MEMAEDSGKNHVNLYRNNPKKEGNGFIDYDFLVIGSGIAGMSYGPEVAKTWKSSYCGKEFTRRCQYILCARRNCLCN